MAGARWVQSEILEEYPEQKLEVYAVWFNMFPGDSRSDWPSGLLTDPRVRHFWDESKLVGRWYGENVTSRVKGHVEWDAYFLYPAEGVWRDVPEPISRGRTIVSTRGRLAEAAADLFGN